jgi:hypothetical protein
MNNYTKKEQDERGTDENEMGFCYGLDGLSPSEEQGRRQGGERFCEISDILKRSCAGIRNTEFGEIVKRQVETIEKYAEKDNFFSIEKVWNEYKSTSGKDIEKLKGGHESSVYILSDDGIKKIIKIAGWDALRTFHLNRTPLEFMINKIVLQNTIFPDTYIDPIIQFNTQESGYGGNRTYNFLII